MNLGNFLQAIISIALVYLMLALLTSELQELLISYFEVRAKRLKQSIRVMLGEEGWDGQTFINDKDLKINNSGGKNVGNYIYLEDQLIKILDKNIEKEFVWINNENKKDVDPPEAIDRDPNDEKSNDGKFSKVPVYIIKDELTNNGKYYINKITKEIQTDFDSITKRLYEHPNITALNQRSFAWLSILGIYFEYTSWKFWRWQPRDWYNLFLTILLIALIVCVFIFQKLILLQIFVFCIFLFVRVASLIYSKRSNIRTSYGPSYIEDSGLFAETLIDVIKNSTQPEHENDKINVVLSRLNFYTPASSALIKIALVSGDASSIDSFKNALKRQYEEVNQRSSGVYKRNSKGLSFALGFLVAVLINADTLHIVTSLTGENTDFSKQITTALENPELTKCDASVQGDCQAKQERLKELISNAGTLPLGWNYDEELGKTKKTIDIVKSNKEIAKKKIEIDKNFNLIQKLEGDKRAILTICNSDVKAKECYEAIETIFLDSKNNDLFPDLSEELKLSFKNVEGAKIEEKSNQFKLFQSAYKKFVIDTRAQLVSLLIDSKKQEVPSVDPVDPGITLINTLDTNQINNTVNKRGGWFSVILGWLITAIAIGMGAPFWFDLLSRIMNVRNAGNYRQRPK